MEIIKTHISGQVHFAGNRAIYEINKNKYGRGREAVEHSNTT